MSDQGVSASGQPPPLTLTTENVEDASANDQLWPPTSITEKKKLN